MRLRHIAFLLLIATVPADVQSARAANRCLSKEQQHAVIASGKAVRLEVALQTAKRKLGGEVVRARLCERDKGLAYLLTLLGHDGKVTRVAIDAVSGAMVDGG